MRLPFKSVDWLPFLWSSALTCGQEGGIDGFKAVLGGVVGEAVDVDDQFLVGVEVPGLGEQFCGLRDVVRDPDRTVTENKMYVLKPKERVSPPFF